MSQTRPLTIPAPNVILRGGPDSLGESDRIRHCENADDVLKLRFGNHYEHFRPTAATECHGDRELRVLQWAGCTYVAE